MPPSPPAAPADPTEPDDQPAVAASEPESAGLVLAADRVPDTPILHGEAAEDPDEYARLRQELADWYDVQGPVENGLLDRVCSLMWRIRRVPRVERGIITRATVGLTFRRTNARITKAKNEQTYAAIATNGMLATTSSVTARRASDLLSRLREDLECAEDGEWDMQGLFKVMFLVFGDDKEGDLGIGGYGGHIAMLAAMLHSTQRGEGPEGADAERLRAALFAALDEMIGMFGGLSDDLAAEDDQRDRAAVEAHALPPNATLKELAAYERHLQRSLREATADLEQAVARRQLAAVGRRVRPGRR